MSYEILFWISVVFHVTRTRIYIGHDERKYEAATLGILLTPSRKN
jgi:hypothetical protein